MAGQYESFREFDLGSGFNLKHDPALVGPVFAQTANNVDVDKDTVNTGHGVKRINDDLLSGGSMFLGDLNLHYGAQNELGDTWDNFNFRAIADYCANASHTTDPATPVIPALADNRFNAGPATRHVIIPYHGVGQSRTLAEGYTLRIRTKLKETFSMEGMRPGHGFPVYQVGGDMTDKFAGFIFGFQLVSPWEGFPTADTGPDAVQRGAAMLVPFVLINDGSAKQGAMRKLMWDVNIEPNKGYMWGFRLDATEGVKLFLNGDECTYFGSANNLDPNGVNCQIAVSPSDTALSYGIGQADRASFLMRGGPFENNTEAVLGHELDLTAITGSTTTSLIVSGLDNTQEYGGWFIFCRSGTSRNVGEFRWVSSSSASGGNTALAIDQAWTFAPSAGDTFECYPVVWTRLERASSDAAYVAEAYISDVHVWLTAKTDVQMSAMAGRSLTRDEIDAEDDLIFYYRGDRATHGVIEDEGPYRNNAFFAGVPASDGDGLFLDGCRSGVRTRWGDGAPSENKTVGKLMDKLLKGQGVTTTATSNKQFAFREDFLFWNQHADLGHYVLAQQGTSDRQYQTDHVTSNAANADHLTTTDDAWIWQLSIAAGSFTPYTSGLNEQNLMLHYRHTDPTNSSDGTTTFIREYAVTLDLYAAGFDISGKEVSISWGLINPNTNVVTTPAANGRLWLRLYHEGELIASGSSTVSHATAPNGDDLLETPFDHLSLGKALMPVTTVGVSLKRFGRGYFHAPIKVLGCWVLPGSESFGSTFNSGEITPGIGRKNKFFGDLGNAGSLIDVTSGSSSVTSNHGDNFNTEDGWETGVYGLTSRYLFVEAAKGETASKRYGRREFWPLNQILTSSGSTLTLDTPLLGFSSKGAPAKCLLIMFGARFYSQEEYQGLSWIPSKENGLKNSIVIPGVIKDEGPFSQDWDFVSAAMTQYIEGGPVYGVIGPGIEGSPMAKITGLVEYENPLQGTTQLICGVGGSLGTLDNGWRRDSFFLNRSVAGKNSDRLYSLEIKRGEDEQQSAGSVWRVVEGRPTGVYGYSRTGLDMTEDYYEEAEIYVDSLRGIRIIRETSLGEDMTGSFAPEENEGEYYTRFYIEDGVPKFAFSTAASNGNAILRPASSGGKLRSGEWSHVGFLHGSSLASCGFFVNGKLIAAEEEVTSYGTYSPTFVANSGSYTADSGYHFISIGVSKPLGRPVQHALGGRISKLAVWNSRKRTASFDPKDTINEATTGAAMYLEFKESRGRSLEDSESTNHVELFGSSYSPFFFGPWPEEGFSLRPFGGRLFFGHKGIAPQVWDGDAVLPVALEEPASAPVVELVTESISFNSGSKAVNNGNDAGKFGWLNVAQKTTYNYKFDEHADACGLHVAWSNKGLQFGGHHWLEAEPDQKFSLGKAEDNGYIVLQGFFQPLENLDGSDRMILVDGRTGARDGWALETVGRRVRFSFWDDNDGVERYIQTRSEVIGEGNWHYFYFRWKVARGSWSSPTSGSWADTLDKDAFVVLDMTESWTYIHSIADADLDFGETDTLFYEDDVSTSQDLTSLRIGGNPLTDDPFSGTLNFRGSMDTIQGQCQAAAADVKIERLFVDSDWANANTNASGDWTPTNDSFPDAARPDLAQNDDIWAWSIEELEDASGYALCRVNIGSGTAGSCAALTQEGSFLDWKFSVVSNNNVPNAAGSHQFAVTLYDPVMDMESPPSPLSTSVSPDGSNEGEATIARWRLSNLPAMPTKSRVWRRVYKTAANQPTLYLAYEIRDTNTAEVDVAPGENFLVTQEKLDFDVFQPPKAGLLSASENSLFYSRIADSPETVVFSDPFFPWKVRRGNTALSESGDGTEVTELYYFRGSMSAFTRRSVYLTTLRELGYTMDKTNSVAGAVGPGCAVDDGEEILLLGSRGFYRGTSAATIRYEGWTLEDFFQNEFDYSRGYMTSAVFDRSTGVVYFLCPTKGDNYPITILRGFKNDHSMGRSTSNDSRREARYAWTKLTGPAITAMAEGTDVDGTPRIAVGNPYGGVGFLEDGALVNINEDKGYSDFRQTDLTLDISSISGNVLTVTDTLTQKEAGLVGSTVVVGDEVANIEAFTTSTLTVDKDSLSGSVGYLGAVIREWQSGWLDFSTFEKRKRATFLDLQFSSATTNTVTVDVYLDFSTVSAKTFTDALSSSGHLLLPILFAKARYFSFRVRYTQADSDFNLLRAGVRLAMNQGQGHSSDLR